MKTIIKTLLVFALSVNAFAQSGTMAPNYVIIPGVTSNGTCDATGKGKTIFNTTTNLMYYCDGTTWQALSGAAATGSVWKQSGVNISNNNTGNVAIGTSTPTQKLEVNGGAKFNGNVYFNFKTIGTNYTIQNGDYFILNQTSGTGGSNIIFPLESLNAGRVLIIKGDGICPYFYTSNNILFGDCSMGKQFICNGNSWRVS